MWYILLLASTTSPVCLKLHEDFDKLEKSWSYASVINSIVRNAAFKMANSGGGNMSDQLRHAQLVREAAEIDRDHGQRADRIVTLMVGHKCALPDHVASAAKYWELAIRE